MISQWENGNRTHQLGEKEQATSSFFEPYGFTVKYDAIKYHFENEDDPESRKAVADKWGWILSKDGSSAIFLTGAAGGRALT